MNSSISLPFQLRPLRHSWVARALAVVAVAALSACGNPSGKDKSASQVAAKVNNGEVTVHQVNFALQQQRGLRPDQAETASARILERLIDQQLAVQKAEALKVDRDPRVIQQIEAARAEIIAKAYFDKISEGVAKPTPEEITSYFNDNPALFRERRVFQLQEIAFDAPANQVEAVRRMVESAKPIDDVLVHLRSNGIQYTTGQAVRAAEQVPLANLTTLAKLRDGQSMLITTPTGAQIVAIVESRSQPIAEDRARPAIEQFIVNDRKRRVVGDDVKALRAAAKIEYMGKFAATAGAAKEAAATPADTGASAAVPTSPATAAKPDAAASPGAAASAGDAGIGTNVINKGLGLK